MQNLINQKENLYKDRMQTDDVFLDSQPRNNSTQEYNRQKELQEEQLNKENHQIKSQQQEEDDFEDSPKNINQYVKVRKSVKLSVSLKTQIPQIESYQKQPINNFNNDQIFEKQRYFKDDNSNSKIPDNFFLNYGYFGQIIMIDAIKYFCRVRKSQKDNPTLLQDLPYLGTNDQVLNKSQEYFQKVKQLPEKKQTPQNLFKILKSTFSTDVNLIYTFVILFILLNILNSYALQLVIDQITEISNNYEKDKSQINTLILLCVLLAFCKIFGNYSLSVANRFAYQFSVKTRNMFINLMYYNILSQSSQEIKKTNTASLINVSSNDFNYIELKALALFLFNCFPVFLVFCSVLLYIRFGFLGLLSLFLQIVFFFILNELSKQYKKSAKLRSKSNDQRLKMQKEIIQGIKLLKMYVWEARFFELIQQIRKIELKKSFLMLFWFYTGEAINQASLFICMVIQIVILMLTDQEDTITTANILSTLDLLGFIQLLLTIGYKGMLGKNEMHNVLQKCYKIYNVKEQKSDIKLMQSVDYTLKLENYTGNWDLSQPDNYFLKDLSFQAKKQQVTAVLGSVSSGKTSFLNIFMNEIPSNKGNIYVNGSIAFAEAEPYIFVGTIRDNIVLDAEFNYEWYVEVLDKCCILEDISKLKNQDQTMVGENSGGVQLSGGQKTRIGLARAVYQNKDIYLLDDPLSSVDVNIANKILKNVIKGLLKNKTVILATHQIEMIQEYVDQVIYLQDKSIIKEGNYQVVKQFINQQNQIQEEKNQQELQEQQNIQIKQKDEQDNKSQKSQKLISLLSKQQTIQQKQNNTEKIKSNLTNFVSNIIQQQNQILNQSIISDQSSIFVLDDQFETVSDEDFDNKQNSQEFDEDYMKVTEIKKELPEIRKFQIQQQVFVGVDQENKNQKKNSQKIGFRVYKQFIQNLGPLIITILSVLHFFIDYYIFLVIFDYFGLYQQSDKEEKYDLTLKISILSIVFLISQIIRFLNWSQLHLRGMYKLHTKMIQTLLQATSQYFDKTPIGNILNKFSNDIGICDVQLFQQYVDFTEKMLQTLVLMGYICFTNQYLIIILVLKLTLLSYFYSVSKDVLNQAVTLDLQNKTPIFSMLTSTVSCITNLNVFELIPLYKSKLSTLVNNSQRCAYSFGFVQRAFSLISQLINSFFGMTIMFSIIFITVNNIQDENDQDERDKMVSNLSIIIVYILKMQDNIPRAFRVISKIDSGLASFNRINNYIDSLPLEQTSRKSQNEFKVNSGQINFNNVSLLYNPKHKPVLNNLSMEIQKNEKVAIIGRSGAGKSTVLQALFRMKEIEDLNLNNKGIFIDSQRIQNYGLNQVRSQISIIPQSPFMFTGTIKFNLDPFNKFDDKQINDLLKELNLSQYLQDSNLDLNSVISSETNLLSIGQRQLICLGRVILQKNKILVIDEATANCDEQTDNLIQSLICKHFKNSTIITIAHRLETIAGYDKILVLDFGEKVEYDHPYILLNNDNIQNPSLFLKMVQQMEKKQQDNIKQIAEQNYNKKNKQK